MKTALLLALVLATAPASAQPSRDTQFHAFLQERFGEDRAAYPDTRYVIAWADLNGDRRQEAVVYMISGNYCGSGGCTLFIYTPEQGSWYQQGSITVSQPPIRVLATRSHGWLDLGIAQRELRGDHFGRYEARLRSNGGTYPGNPSVAPAERVTRPTRGRVLIAPGDRGRRLF